MLFQQAKHPDWKLVEKKYVVILLKKVTILSLFVSNFLVNVAFLKRPIGIDLNTLVQVLQLGMFTWQTQLKYPESKPSTPLTLLKYPSSMSKYLDMDEGY